MVRDGRVGRPPAAGPRYDCGRRKPQGDPRGLAIANWLKHEGARAGLDPRLRCELLLLAQQGLLTARQVAAGLLVGRIYGTFERFKRRRRSAASPSYLRAFGDPDGDDETDRDVLDRMKTARRRWLELQDEIKALPVNAALAREQLEALCVEDRPIPAANLDSVAAMLDRIADKFEIARVEPPRRSAVAIASGRRRPPRKPQDTRSAPPRRHEEAAFLKVAKALRPDLGEEGAAKAFKVFNRAKAFAAAKADRERFRREKGQGQP